MTGLQTVSVVASSIDMNDEWHFGHDAGSDGVGSCSSEGLLRCTTAGGCIATATLTGIPTGGSQYVRVAALAAVNWGSRLSLHRASLGT